MAPLLLDLFCGAGGAAKGYHDAGFDVIGVDLNPQPRFPFRFVQADALQIVRYLRWGQLFPGLVHGEWPAAVHASPPCQRYSRMSNSRPALAATYPDLIAPTRAALEALGLPFVIENVPGAPLRDPVTLCGLMFGRELYRHRLFETSWPLAQPEHPEHVKPASKAGHWRPGTVMSVSGHVAPVAMARELMGIDWTTREELAEAIPPYMAEYVGRQLRAELGLPAAA